MTNSPFGLITPSFSFFGWMGGGLQPLKLIKKALKHEIVILTYFSRHILTHSKASKYREKYKDAEISEKLAPVFTDTEDELSSLLFEFCRWDIPG